MVGAALWIFIAQMCRRGHNWARVTATVLFAIATVDMLIGPVSPEPFLVRVWTLVVWVVGLA